MGKTVHVVHSLFLGITPALPERVQPHMNYHLFLQKRSELVPGLPDVICFTQSPRIDRVRLR